MDQVFELEKKSENVENHESAPEEVDDFKVKKDFFRQNQQPERKAIVSCYENTKGIEDFVNTLPYIDENPQDLYQSNDCYHDLKLSLGNKTTGPKMAKVFLETDFPVIEEKPTTPYEKTSLPSEQKKLDWLQNKGNFIWLNLFHNYLFFLSLVSTANIIYCEQKPKPAGN